MWFNDEAKTKVHALGWSGRNFSGIRLNYEMLIGKGKWENTEKETALPCIAFTYVHKAALCALEKIDSDTEFKEIYTLPC